jgi:SAM-dependent methyltransferase
MTSKRVPTDPAEKVRWVYESKDTQELSGRYDDWAESYDEDLERHFDYRGPRIVVDAVETRVPTDGRVLDAGVGTGLVGIELHGRGYRNIVGIDLSTGMLDEARKKSVYSELRQMVLGEPLDFPDDEFDATVSVGTFTLGHAPASGFRELVRVTRGGGAIVFTLHVDAYEQHGFKQEFDQLEADGKWSHVETVGPMQIMPKGAPEVFHCVWVFEVSRR